MTKLKTAFLVSLLALPVFWLLSLPATSEALRVEASQFSGKPVPRYESLRYSAVHGRQGPSLNHRILWRYEREGLPMLIVRETHGWRRVRDKDGDEVWMQARMLSETRTALVLADTELYAKPGSDGSQLATLQADVIVTLSDCADAWCKVEVAETTGWVAEASLWGSKTSGSGV